MLYSYFAYGLVIHSQLKLPELLPYSGTNSIPPDVKIQFADVPSSLEQPRSQGVLYQVNPSQFLLTLDHVARYLVQNTNEILIAPEPDADERDIRIFLLGSCIGALLHQRGILAFHAATMKTDKGAVLFTGPSGMGKSTLLGEFLSRGYQMLADDVTGITLNPESVPIVLPAFPRTRLWEDAAKILEYDVDTLTSIREGLRKFDLHVPAQFATRSVVIHRIYRLMIINQDDIVLTPVPLIENFQIVLNNTYRRHMLHGMEMRETHFELVSAVARTANVLRAKRPSVGYRLKELADLIEEDIHR